MNLSLYERETIITYNAEEKQAELYTADRTIMHRLDKLVEECPKVYSLKECQTDKGEIWSKTYTISDKKFISLRKPIQYSEERRKANAKILAAARAMQEEKRKAL